MILNEDGISVASCYLCDFHVLRRNIVNGFGNKQERSIVFIGEAPGATEDNHAIPFVGRAGQLFNNFLEAVGLNRDIVYVTNIIKCRPPRNRTPYYNEIQNCIPCLMAEIKTLKPKIIVLMGVTATTAFYQNTNLTVAKIRNQFIWENDRLIVSIYHPSYIDRNKDNDSIVESYYDMFKQIAKAYKALINPTFILQE